MGIFGNKQQSDQASSATQADPQAVGTNGSIDGVMSAPQSESNGQHIAVQDFGSDGVPPLNNQPDNGVGDYIMTNPPEISSAPQPAWNQQDGHSHDDGAPADSAAVQPQDDQVQTPDPSSIQPPQADDAASQPQDESVSSVPSTHPLPGVDSATSNDKSEDADDELSVIKSQALKELSPLVAHLDQSPEERFHTAMMMLQATDDRTLVKAAYEAAQQITDDKAKAQALLDIVNEINYFTHKS